MKTLEVNDKIRCRCSDGVIRTGHVVEVWSDYYKIQESETSGFIVHRNPAKLKNGCLSDGFIGNTEVVK